MNADPMAVRLPTVEEVLAGETQGGVAPPPAFAPHEDDGTVQRVGSTVLGAELGVRGAAAELKAARAAAAAARDAVERAHRAHNDTAERVRRAEDAFAAAVDAEFLS